MPNLIDRIVGAAAVVRRFGLRGYLRRRAWRARQSEQSAKVGRWLKHHGHRLSTREIDELRTRIEQFSHSPLISIIMPVYEVEERWLRAAIESVRRQVYETWELCIADDNSPSPHIRLVLDEFASQDSRIKVVYRESNGHISAASNSALELATGELVGFLDHDDELTEDALFCVVEMLDRSPDVQMLYSDEDVINDNGERHSPKFKPDWSRDLFYSVNYATHFSVYRISLIRQLGGFRAGVEGSQDYDLALRVIEHVDDGSIAHIPRVLYHWRAIQGSVALAGSEKPYAHERARAAIREHFARTSVAAEVVESDFDLHRVVYRMPTPRPSVNLIIRAEHEPKRALPDSFQTITIKGNHAGELNEAVRRGNGDVLLFIDVDLNAIDPGGWDDLIATAIQPAIGAVGARIVGADGIVEQAGIVLEKDLSPAFAHNGFPREVAGNLFRNTHIGNFSAVSVACMAIRRELFEDVGAFHEKEFPLSLFDVDLCLRLRERGKRMVVLPHAEFMRRGAPTDRTTDPNEIERFRQRWGDYLPHDPFCNPNLKRDGTFEIA